MIAPPGLRLLVTADAVGGVWQYTADLAHALAPLGITAIVAVLGPAPSPAQRALMGEVPLIETGLPLDWLAEGPAPVRAAGHAIAELANKASFDLVQLNSPALGAEARFAAPVIAVTHGCLATWWRAVHGEAPPPELRWQEALNREGLRVAQAIVAPTAAHARAVADTYALPTLPIAVHNGRRALARARPAATRDVVFTVGRLWDEAKDIALLDRVAARIAVPFRAAGAIAGPHGQRIALSHLHHLGAIDEATLARELARQPLFVSAARFEPFGLAVLEAAQAGCPLVLADIASFRELWDGAAAFVAPGDEDGFVRAIEALIGDEPRRRTLGRAAQARAARYTPAATATAMAALYRRPAAVKQVAA